MNTLLVFAAVLLVAVLVSSFAERTILSASVLFLAAGFFCSESFLGILLLTPGDPSVQLVAELALFGILFTDGMRVGWSDLRSAGHLPGRALLLGMPISMTTMALLAHCLLGMSWSASWLIGAALAPTDPVFASAILGKEKVPHRLRRLLNVESGLNDGLALPVVVILLAMAEARQPDIYRVLGEVAAGILIGVAIPFLAIRLEKSRFFSISPTYRPLNAFAIGLLVLATAWKIHANQFLAAFSAGVTMDTLGPESRDAFHRFGELVAELLKLVALLLFGALISVSFLKEISWSGYVFVALVLFVVRPVALGVSLLGSGLNWRERAVAAWFGPKGFASVVYGLIILRSGIGSADELFHLIALAVAVSITLHSSTDVLMARLFGG